MNQTELYNEAEQRLGRQLEPIEKAELWHNYTFTGDWETDVDDAIERTFEQ